MDVYFWRLKKSHLQISNYTKQHAILFVYVSLAGAFKIIG